MSELRDLYQEVILDHGKRPRNFEAMADADRMANGHNPLCGDKIAVFVKLDGDRIEKVSFSGTGCAISTASASMMTDAMVGMTLEEVETLFQTFHRLLTTASKDDPLDPSLKKLVVFAGVREFPIRVKCATLPWHTVRAALQKRETAITTE
jgi:nitrogen fixation NifU-like protein